MMMSKGVSAGFHGMQVPSANSRDFRTDAAAKLDVIADAIDRGVDPLESYRLVRDLRDIAHELRVSAGQ